MTAKETAKPRSQARGVFFERTMLAILSVTLAKVWPGPMIGCSAGAARPVLATPGLRDLGVRVADVREVRRAGAGLELRQQAVAAGARPELCHPARPVVQVAEHDRAGGAGRLAGGDDLAVP